MFIMLDGIDGSGKSTVLNGWKSYLQSQGAAVFDLKAFMEANGRFPDPSEISTYQYILSCEPTYVGIGRVIREELIKSGTAYPPLAIAESYSLDRLILYTKVLLPALQKNIHVLQDRGIASSLAYQPLMHRALSRSVLARLPGNALALANAPHHLVLVQAEASTAIRRLTGRTGKQDNVIFERADFLKKLASVYASQSFQKFFTRRGTTVHTVRGDVQSDIMVQEAITLLKSLLT